MGPQCVSAPVRMPNPHSVFIMTATPLCSLGIQTIIDLACAEVATRQGRDGIESVLHNFDGLHGVDGDWESWLLARGVERRHHGSQGCSYIALGTEGAVEVVRWESAPLIGMVHAYSYAPRRAFGRRMDHRQRLPVLSGRPGYVATSLDLFSQLAGPLFDEGDLTARISVLLYAQVFGETPS